MGANSQLIHSASRFFLVLTLNNLQGFFTTTFNCYDLSCANYKKKLKGKKKHFERAVQG